MEAIHKMKAEKARVNQLAAQSEARRVKAKSKTERKERRKLGKCCCDNMDQYESWKRELPPSVTKDLLR